MSLEGYISFSSNQLYADYVDYYWNEDTIKYISMMLRVKIDEFYHSFKVSFIDHSPLILNEQLHCYASFMINEDQLLISKKIEVYSLKNQCIGYIYFVHQN
ncbi:hypothetical protein GCM10023206_00660 [Acinetobacter puyangensis]|uniref:Uncharacterized protein n=1 Tax=Acinetobacter puyangensis TaxID=1096779 RepID=A0A240E766_9GAMM|nr:hypothetical protein [Acinetobacter puyangensis]SNX44584.1 hypothetical protein SAMN05421731_103322 [Acinetobacter puyangensis]